jgi:hypothetical protein
MARFTERREGGNPVSPGNLQVRSTGAMNRGIAPTRQLKISWKVPATRLTGISNQKTDIGSLKKESPALRGWGFSVWALLDLNQ